MSTKKRSLLQEMDRLEYIRMIARLEKMETYNGKPAKQKIAQIKRILKKL